MKYLLLVIVIGAIGSLTLGTIWYVAQLDAKVSTMQKEVTAQAKEIATLDYTLKDSAYEALEKGRINEDEINRVKDHMEKAGEKTYEDFQAGDSYVISEINRIHGFSAPTTVADDSVTPKTDTAYDYEWDDLSSEYANNSVAAHLKHDEQTILIRGVIDEIGYESNPNFGTLYGTPTVEFKASSASGASRLFCGFKNPDELENLSVGDTVILSAKIKQFSDVAWGAMYAYPCSIVE